MSEALSVYFYSNYFDSNTVIRFWHTLDEQFLVAKTFIYPESGGSDQSYLNTTEYNLIGLGDSDSNTHPGLTNDLITVTKITDAAHFDISSPTINIQSI